MIVWPLITYVVFPVTGSYVPCSSSSACNSERVDVSDVRYVKGTSTYGSSDKDVETNFAVCRSNPRGFEPSEKESSLSYFFRVWRAKKSSVSSAVKRRRAADAFAREPGAAAAPGAALETVSATVSTTRGTVVERRASPAPATAEPSFVATEKATKRRAPSTPLLAASALAARAAEEDAWDEIVSAGWAAWRRLGGSDRRARVKTAARRAESAVLVAKEGREACAEAARRYDALLAEVEAARLEEETSGETGAVGSASAAERQRLTLASHEVDAETAGSERKWESLRDKAVQATRALETELRALG